LYLSGKSIRQSRINGTFNISSMFLFGNHTQDSLFEFHSSLSLLYTSFEKFGAEIVSVSNGIGIDSNQNGLFDYLLVTVDLDLANQSNYTLTGELNLNGQTIVSAINSTYMLNGTRKMNLYFDGKEIYAKRLNGPFNVTNVKLLDVFGKQLDSYPINVQTLAYSYKQFEKPPMDFTGIFSENSISFNKDARIDAIRLNATVNISLPGTYFISGVLTNANYEVLSDNLTILNLTTGVKSIVLDFNGFDLGESGSDGPYAFAIVATDENGTTLGTFPTINYTRQYNFTQFERNFNPITGCNPINESGLFRFIANVTCIGNYIDITADNVTLDCAGFELLGNSSVNYPGIAIHSNYNLVTNCKIKNFSRGIYIAGSFNAIEDNSIEQSIKGIVFDLVSNNNTISGNFLQNNTDGLTMLGTGTSQWNLIYDNYFSNFLSNVAIAHDGNFWNTSRIHGTNIMGGPIISVNYWSDYIGIDTDGDYIGDTDLPYNSNDAILAGGDFSPLTLVPKCGDVNNDGKINVVDLTYLTSYLFKGGPAPLINKFSGDANGDGKVNVVDLTYLVNYLFKGGPAPTTCGGITTLVETEKQVLPSLISID
ncbi:MAG: NosD domain-containing protein, partial [Candidatus Micrarchaeota archaeon]